MSILSNLSMDQSIGMPEWIRLTKLTWTVVLSTQYIHEYTLYAGTMPPALYSTSS